MEVVVGVFLVYPLNEKVLTKRRTIFSKIGKT